MRLNLMRHNPIITIFRAPDDGAGNGQGSTTTAGATTTADGEGSATTKPAESTDDSLPKSKEEFEKLLQSEGDKRVNQALRKAQAERDKAIEAAVAEALENEKMSQKEREEKARRKELELIEQGKREVAEGKRQLLIVDKMTELKVPDVVMAMRNSITAQDEEGIITEVKGMISIFEAGKAAAMQERLAQAAVGIEGHDKKPGDGIKQTGDPVLDALNRATKKG